MRVLFFEDGVGFGGAQISLSELLDGLAGMNDFDYLILTSAPDNVASVAFNSQRYSRFRRPLNYQTRFQVADRIERMSIPAVVKTMLFKAYIAVHSVSELLDSIRLYLHIIWHRIDLVHSNNGWTDAVVRAAVWAGRPCVMHFRGFPGESLRKGRIQLLNRGHLRAIAISGAIGDRLEQVGFPSHLISVIHNPINIRRYDAGASRRENVRRACGFMADEVVVAIFGRITPWKGQLEFLQAALAIAAEIPALRVLVVGDESDASVRDYWGAVKEAAATPPLRGRVVFAGYQPDPCGHYWASDIVVHNSIEPEPFGRVITEAMACCRPVIAMREGGPMDILEHETNGLLVEPRDPAALAAAIRRLAQSPEARIRMGEAARRTVETRFSHLFVSGQVWRVYDSVLSQPC